MDTDIGVKYNEWPNRYRESVSAHPRTCDIYGVTKNRVHFTNGKITLCRTFNK